MIFSDSKKPPARLGRPECCMNKSGNSQNCTCSAQCEYLSLNSYVDGAATHQQPFYYSVMNNLNLVIGSPQGSRYEDEVCRENPTGNVPRLSSENTDYAQIVAGIVNTAGLVPSPSEGRDTFAPQNWLTR